MSGDAAILSDDPAILKAMIAALQAENARMTATLQAHEQLVQALRLRIAKLQKQAFGKSSEKIEREIAQLELALEDLLVAVAEQRDRPTEEEDPAATDTPIAEVKPRRRPRVSDATPRERRVLDPGTCCPDCGGNLRVVGEDVSELLELVAAQMKVIRIARMKKAWRGCEKMVQPVAPSRPIPGSMAGPGLLAQILVSKFDDHLPLYRQSEIYARMGADIPDSTLLDWCGRAMKVLAPVIERIEAEVMVAPILHADDTPIRVLDRSRRDRGLGKGVKQRRVWAYVSDQRPWAGTAPSGVVYRFSPVRKGEYPQRHLRDSGGILQADAYAGFNPLYATRADGSSQFREAACWAHLRHDFHDVREIAKSEIALEALDRIGKLYDAKLRQAARQAHSRPMVDAF
tara:strand:+ start:14103 stop:15305 length:1203 start_codon:yes stop_codon:yes gene_type:complete